MLMTAGPRITMNIAGMMHRIRGEHELHGQFHGLLLSSLGLLQTHLSGLHAQYVGDRDTQLLGLDHGVQEDPEVVNACPIGQRLECVRPAGADLDLSEDPRELLRQRALGVVSHLGECCVECQARTPRRS